MSDIERELGWEDTIQKDAGEYTLLPEGDYNFTIESFDRGRHNGSDKLPACNKAILRLRIDHDGDVVTLNKDLFLHSKMEGMLSSFFACIGQKKKGEPLKMNWSSVPGSVGRIAIGQKTFDGKQYNEIKKFYPKEAGPVYKVGDF